MRAQQGGARSWRCPSCREPLTLPELALTSFTVITEPGRPREWVVEVEGAELHRCVMADAGTGAGRRRR